MLRISIERALTVGGREEIAFAAYGPSVQTSGS